MNAKDLRILKDIFGDIPEEFLNTNTTPISSSYPVVYSTGILSPNSFNVVDGETDTLILDASDEEVGYINDYQGTLTSTGSLTIDVGSSTLKSNIDITSLESGETYVFSIIGNKEIGYFCAINKFS